MAEYTDAEKAIIRRDLDAGKIAPDLLPKARQVLGITEAPATPAGSPQPTAPVGPPGMIEITKERPDAAPTSKTPTPQENPFAWYPGGEALQFIAGKTKTPPPEYVNLPGAEVPGLTTLLSSPELLKMGAALGINLATTGGGAALGGVPGAMVGGGAGRAINKRLGLEEPGVMGDIMAYAAPLIPGGPKGAKDLLKTLTRYSRAGRAMTAAEEATQASRESWAAQTRNLGVKEGIAKQAAAEKAAQQTLGDRMKWAARSRQMQADFAREVSEAAQEARQMATDLQLAYRTKQADAYAEALAKAKDAQARYRRAVQQHRQATTQARDLPGTMAPPIAAADLYADFAEEFGPRAVTMTEGNSAAARVLNQLGGHFEVLQQPRMQAIATEMLATQNADVVHVHQWLKDLGPMTRHRDSTIRGAARQLYRGLQESLTSVPGAPASLRAANTAARKEFALDDLERFIRRAVHGPERMPRLNGERLAEQVRNAGAEDPLFRGSFTNQEWHTLMTNLDALAEATPSAARIPVPGNIPVKDVGPPPRAVPAKVVPPPRYPVYPPERVPGAVPETQYPPFPSAADPRDYLKQLSLGRLGAEAVIGGTEVGMLGHVGPWSVAMMGLATADVTGYGLARLLLTPRAQPWLRKMITPAGTIDPRVLAVFGAAARLPWAAGPLDPQGATP